MFKTMIEHYSPLMISIKTLFGYKTSSFIETSITVVGTIPTPNYIDIILTKPFLL